MVQKRWPKEKGAQSILEERELRNTRAKTNMLLKAEEVRQQKAAAADEWEAPGTAFRLLEPAKAEELEYGEWGTEHWEPPGATDVEVHEEEQDEGDGQEEHDDAKEEEEGDREEGDREEDDQEDDRRRMMRRMMMGRSRLMMLRALTKPVERRRDALGRAKRRREARRAVVVAAESRGGPDTAPTPKALARLARRARAKANSTTGVVSIATVATEP